jgi:hypothetical protein
LNCFFKKQGLHLALLCVLSAVAWIFGSRWATGESVFLGLSPRAWFFLAWVLPILHQSFVWVVWRTELCFSGITRAFGPTGFTYYAIGFSVLGISRVLGGLGLGIADRQSMGLNPVSVIIAVIILTPPMVYTFYSVAKYFGFRRAFGIDHFDETYRDKPFVKAGIFKYTSNAMYTFGFLLFWIIAIAFNSKLALLCAFFNHAYVWIHYYCTERPDMALIYGSRVES